MLNDQWGPWIKHDGSRVPEPAGTVVFVERAGGRQHSGIVSGKQKSGWNWEVCISHGRPQDCVIRYRKRKPLGLVILEELIADFPAEAVPA